MLKDLSWLPSPPSDYRQQRAAAKQDLQTSRDGAGIWSRLRALAAFGLDETQLNHLAGLLSELPEAPGLPARHSLAIVGDGTLSLLGPPIAASAVRWDIRLETVEGDYGAAVSEAMDPESPIHQARPDFVLVACDRRGLGLNRTQPSEAAAYAQVDAAFATIRTIVEGLRPSVGRGVLVQTIVPPMEPLFGSFDVATIASPYAQVMALNARLVAWAAEAGVVLVDAARLAASVGLENWDDPRQWHASKLPFAFDFIPLYADIVARTLAAALGKSRKCLVLDLDNTLWGGVIGDDGVGGIALGQGTATGEAFIAIQQMALDLRKRGIVLAVCSKNEPDAARLPFREHSEMVLSEEHIAVFQANWVDKAANLKAIAEALNIGLDALVFLDDNPAEREQVRRELPMVAVPEVGSDPALYPSILLAGGYFDAVSFGTEDQNRAADYQANAQRASLQAGASNMGDYLRSLDMTCTLRGFNAEGRARIAQLINKSNQFNLTTRRYTEQEVAGVETDPARYTLQVQLVDRFANNGMISVIIAEKGEEAWTIDTWLMSCRVLGRRVEEAVLDQLVSAAKAAGAKALIGQYFPTDKNRMVSEHYRKLGFRQVGDLPGSGVLWRLDLVDYAAPDLPMKIEAEDLAPHIDAAD